MSKTHCCTFIDTSGHREDFVLNESQFSNLFGRIKEDRLLRVGDVYINMRNISFILMDKVQCDDCGVPYGQKHLLGCDRVICKECYNQALSCDC